MKQQNKLRNALQEYYDNQETPFNEGDWEQASAYLNTARRKRRIRYSGLILTTLLSILFIATYSFKKFSDGNDLQMSSVSIKELKSTSIVKQEVLPTPTVSKSKINVSIHQNPTKKSLNSSHTEISEIESHRNIIETKADLSLNDTSQNIESKITEPKLDALEINKILNKENPINNLQVIAPALVVIKSKNDDKKDDIANDVDLNSKKDAEVIPLTIENVDNEKSNLPAKEIPQIPTNITAQITTSIALNDSKKEIEKINEPKYNNATEKAFTPC
jgi:hypothetical protein